jgi:hypothetical protein
MGNSTPGFSTGCEGFGVLDFSPTSGGTGGLLPAPKRIC